MGDISDHFSRSEFRCRCGCGKDTIDAGLIATLERVRDHFDVPIHVTSGNRCETYNTHVGGAPNSQHLVSRAADIQVSGVSPAAVYAYLAPFHEGGLGGYPTFTHVDSRDGVARWDG